MQTFNTPLPSIVSCFIKIQIGLTFLLPAYQGCPGKEAVKQVSEQLQLFSDWWITTLLKIADQLVNIWETREWDDATDLTYAGRDSSAVRLHTQACSPRSCHSCVATEQATESRLGQSCRPAAGVCTDTWPPLHHSSTAAPLQHTITTAAPLQHTIQHRCTIPASLHHSSMQSSTAAPFQHRCTTPAHNEAPLMDCVLEWALEMIVCWIGAAVMDAITTAAPLERAVHHRCTTPACNPWPPLQQPFFELTSFLRFLSPTAAEQNLWWSVAQVLVGWISFVSSNQQRQSTEENSKHWPQSHAGLILSPSSAGLMKEHCCSLIHANKQPQQVCISFTV